MPRFLKEIKKYSSEAVPKLTEFWNSSRIRLKALFLVIPYTGYAPITMDTFPHPGIPGSARLRALR
jgi:hypothetical protein